MSIKYRRGYRSVYSLSVHIVFVTKYRRKIITAPMMERLREIFNHLCDQWKGELREFNGENDHVHLVVDYSPDVRLSELVNNLKSVSSRLIRKEFADAINQFYSKPVFWTASYFVASCGGVTPQQLKTYVEKQSSPAS